MTDTTALLLIQALESNTAAKERNTTALMEALPYLAGLDRLKSAQEREAAALAEARKFLSQGGLGRSRKEQHETQSSK